MNHILVSLDNKKSDNNTSTFASNDLMASNYAFDTWSCDQCTYANSYNFTKCEICENPRVIQTIDSKNHHDTPTVSSELSSATSFAEPSAYTTTSVHDCSEYSSSSLEKNSNSEQILQQKDNCSSKWGCEKCTFENESNVDRCSMCEEGLRPYMLTQTMCDRPPQQPLSSNSLQPDKFPSKLFEDESNTNRYSACRDDLQPNALTKVESNNPSEETLQSSSSQQDKISSKWECEGCAFENESNVDRCSMCREGLRPYTMTKTVFNHPSQEPLKSDSPIPESNLYSTLVRDNSTRKEIDTTMSPVDDKTSTSSIYPSKSEQKAVVFIPDLPFNKSNTELTQMIRLRLSNNYRIDVIDVKCHSNISVGIIYLKSEEDKNYLIKNIQSTILDPQTNTIIKFVEELQLISYLVFDQNMKAVITPKSIADRWRQLCNSSQLSPCEIVAAQYPNIFKIVSRSLDELLTIQNLDVFAVNGQITRIYLNADCSFFEDLPHNVTVSQITVAINAQIGDQFDLSSLYVQYNKAASSAFVLATNRARQWANINYITLNGQNCMKKKSLRFRLVIHSIPREIPIDSILQHKQLQNAVIHSTRIADKVIIEVKDKSVYDACINAAAIRINDLSALIEPFTTIIKDPENMEINAETWYETEMLDYQPDLKYFMDNPQHSIFKYKWNAQSWLEQYQRYQGKHNDENDKQRRLLRVTVMLNTISILSKKGYTIEINNNTKEIKLNLERMKNIIYNHRSKLQNRKEITTSIPTPYPSTIVKVVNEDCLVVYQRLASEHNRPVLLNMANAQTPGGGYRKGAGAQEENIFRRSNYYLNLDMEFDYKNQADRFFCTSNCEQKSIDNDQKIYPIEEYGAIYTSGITVFRHSEDKGYAYLEQPVYGVCAIASAAYARPELKRADNNMLADKFAVDTRKKIENIFSIAYHHGHDCLVLSAYGCGAFKNPPTHIAMIFKSVIEQYAGYFKIIYFSIIDDHSTGTKLNPDGNYLPFKNILDDIVVQSSKHELDVNMISGPFRAINKTQGKLTIDDVKIFDLPPCKYGSLCHELNDTQHCQSYSHPPLCPQYDSCEQSGNDEVHSISFIHRTQCVHGGMCKSMEDDKHLRLYSHPVFCNDRGFCTNMEKNHLIKFCHVSLCRDGLRCPFNLPGNSDHRRAYRHCQLSCQFNGYCTNFHDQDHITDQSHPFRSPCPLTPYVCKYHNEYIQTKKDHLSKLKREIIEHCHLYSHICPFGRQCHSKDDLHNQTSIHIARNICSDFDRCPNLKNEEHLNSFTHKNIHDIRFVCKYSSAECHERGNLDHIIHYRHTGNYNHIGIARYSGLNKDVNFVRNQHHIIKAVQTYTESQKWTPVKDHIKEITEWIRCLQPVHRCDKVIFESILLHGNVMSRKYMDMLRNAQYVANAVDQHQIVRKIFNQYNNDVLKVYGRDFIRALVAIEFDKAASQRVPSIDSIGIASAYQQSHAYIEQSNIVKMNKSLLRSTLKDDEITTISKLAIQIAEASLKLHANPTGIGYKPDEAFGTNNHVFSIFGPNLGHYYGDIFIVFKHEIMFHPDSNFSIQAATTYGDRGNAYKQRPWLKDPGTPKERIQHYHWTKLHCSISGYEYAAAMELIALTGLKKKTMDVKLKDIQEHWTHNDPHQVFEGHLPQLISLDYIDHIYMPKNVFAALSSSAQFSVKGIFRHNLTVTEHVVDLTTQQLDAARTSYQKYVTDEIKKKITNNNFDSHRGTIITLPPSNFRQYICIPMTITQSFYQHQSMDHKQIDNIFIYWQALGGGMMLTISKYQIESSKDQNNNPSLMCYIADIPSFNSNNVNDYRESYSYITNGHPFAHDMLVQYSNFKAKSHSFHRGCNIYDYIGYCLKINRKTNEVSLTHVGANSIYNHQVLSHTFHRSEFDLTKLDYIQISANNRLVPIRNLVIRHEPIQEYHPSFDKDFKEGSEPLKRSSSAAASSGPSKDDEEQSLWGYIKEKVGFKDNKDDSTVKPCPDSVNCLLQYSSEESTSHNKKYSHPCRFSELCRSKSDHPHLEHNPHLVSLCRYDKTCRDLVNPIHRAQYRHTNLPDFLVPCRRQKNCPDKSTQHRIKYSHGEKIVLSSAAASSPTDKHNSSKSAYGGGHKDDSTQPK